MSSTLMIAMPLLGAALPIVVTPVSGDKDMRAVGRAAMKYALALPLVLLAGFVAATGLVA
jgi:hypothetical protein